jgi:kynurenine formamidase
LKYIDLTYPIQAGMAVYPGDPEVTFSPVAEMPQAPCRVMGLSFGSHTGTHMDAPAHMIEEGATLDEYPLTHFMGRAQVFPGDTDFGSVDLTQLDYVILNFDWAKRRGTEGYFTECPALTSRNAAILSISGLKGVGMDTPSVDNHVTELVNHRILLDSGLVLIEGLCNLERVGDQPFQLTALPLLWKKADGAPCRAIAQVEETL